MTLKRSLGIVRDSDVEEHDPQAARKLFLAKTTGELLEQHYSGHAWMVRVEMGKTGGLISISIPAIMGNLYYFNIQLSTADSPEAFKKKILHAGGEILERFNLPRGAFSEVEWKEAMAKSPNPLVLDLSPLQ